MDDSIKRAEKAAIFQGVQEQLEQLEQAKQDLTNLCEKVDSINLELEELFNRYSDIEGLSRINVGVVVFGQTPKAFVHSWLHRAWIEMNGLDFPLESLIGFKEYPNVIDRVIARLMRVLEVLEQWGYKPTDEEEE